MSSANARERVVGHRVAAVLHHDDLAVEPLQPRQRLGEDWRALAVALAGRGRPALASSSGRAHVEYAEFSCT